ncbi:MAG TPA: chromosome segregation ATPase, partial [Allocoleopsis sp.]
MENQENHSNIANSEQTQPSSQFKLPTFGFLKSMPFFSLILIASTVSLGYFGINLLTKNPAAPNCAEDIFLPTASASVRLFCAQEAAKKQTLDDLIQAIELVNVLPIDHPLRSELNRNIDQWTLDILKLGDNKYQEGKLDEALAIAEKVPTTIPNYTLVEKQINQWKTTWKKAEELYELAENDLRESRWNKAYESALKLTNLRNRYWGKIKYDQIVDKLTIAREDSAKLDQSYRLRRWGGVENLLEAIKLAKQVEKESYAYKEAQTLITTCGQKLLVIAEGRLKVQDWPTALEIAKKIPNDSSLEQRTKNVINLANALSKAEEGKVSSIQSAILLAQNIDQDSHFYAKAQKMIVSWQKEIEGVVH